MGYCIIMFLNIKFGETYLPAKIQYPVYTFSEFTFFAILILQQLKGKGARLFLKLTSLFFLFFQTIYFLLEHKKKFDSVPIGVETILIFIFVSLFFAEQLKQVDENPIYTNYFFWIAVGLIVYLGGSFFIFILTNSLSSSEIDSFWYWTFIAEIIKNLLIIFAIFLYAKRKPQNNNQPNRSIPYLDMI